MKKVWLILKLIVFGRQAVSKELKKLRNDRVLNNGYISDFSGIVRKDNQWHHLWNVKTFPFFAFEDWNGVVLTEKEHKRFHSWRGGTKKWCTPFHYYYWKTLVRK